LDAVENPLLDPVVWVVLGLLLAAGFVSILAIGKGLEAFGNYTRWVSGRSMLEKLGILLVVGVFAIFAALLMLLSSR
jgi:hypothetical protein